MEGAERTEQAEYDMSRTGGEGCCVSASSEQGAARLVRDGHDQRFRMDRSGVEEDGDAGTDVPRETVKPNHQVAPAKARV